MAIKKFPYAIICNIQFIIYGICLILLTFLAGSDAFKIQKLASHRLQPFRAETQRFSSNKFATVYEVEPTEEKIDNILQIAEDFKEVHLIPNALSANICQYIIDTAEKYADNYGGWTTTRHLGYPTTDIPYHFIGFDSELKIQIEEKILDKMSVLYNLFRERLSIGEMFIAKYEYLEGKQSSLRPHRDGHPFSFIINLNTPDLDFNGGK